MTFPRATFFFVALAVLHASPGIAGSSGSGSIYQGRRQATGVIAQTRTYRSPPRTNAASSAPAVRGVRYSRGPVLVPLAGMTFCGHDPTIPGGLTCALPPPPRPRLSNNRPPRRQPTPDEVARVLADRAISLAPRPQLRLAPARRGLTGLPSYFWLARRPRRIEASAGVGGVTVIAQARPVQFVWNYGDGTDHATRRSGRKWTRRRPGTIQHTYEGKGRYSLVVEVIWEARWRLGLGPWQSLGYFTNSATRSYRVRSVVPVLVKAR
ncbi:MAG: hypothetical protein QOG04_1864 [Actinomycetota bacterium]|jgi:hypothetical protein|nr:hypothetical protein [Actinomycetota bacterium]